MLWCCSTTKQYSGAGRGVGHCAIVTWRGVARAAAWYITQYSIRHFIFHHFHHVVLFFFLFLLGCVTREKDAPRKGDEIRTGIVEASEGWMEMGLKAWRGARVVIFFFQVLFRSSECVISRHITRTYVLVLFMFKLEYGPKQNRYSSRVFS